jgi:hypothetical protein
MPEMKGQQRTLNTASIVDVFRPLQNQMCWGCKRGYGSFLTIEFGAPHLRIREPFLEGDVSEGKHKQRLLGRRVRVVGDWHLWIQDASWRFEVGQAKIESSRFDAAKLDAALPLLDGQRLTSVEFDVARQELHWSFDGDGHLFAWPDDEAEGDCWSLFAVDESSVSCRTDGTLVYDRSGR